MNTENLSGRIERELLEKVWEKFKGKTKTDSYRAAFLCALDCNTREHTTPLASGESVTQQDVMEEVVKLLDVREKALLQQIETLKEGMTVLNNNIKKINPSSNVEDRLAEMQHNIDTLSGMIPN